VIAERYRLVRPLGVGSSATVWEATDIVLERSVAVKLLRDAAADDQAERERLRREARTLARLAHPRIITVWDFFETDLPGAPQQPVLVTELVGGTSLAERLEQGPLPGNVVLIGEGLKLLDFGIARTPNDAQLTGNLTIGTPLCMAPEQIRGRSAVPESDIYALGCVLFWCLTGRPPYQGGDIADIFEAHLCDPPPVVDVDGLPPEIVEFCTSCLEKNPSFRPDAERAVATLIPGEERTAVITPPAGAERERSGRLTGRFGTGTLSGIKAATGKFATVRIGAGRGTAGRASAGTPGEGGAAPEAGVDTIAHPGPRDRTPLIPVVAAVTLFLAVSITAVLLLISSPGGSGTPVAAPTGGPGVSGQGSGTGPSSPSSPGSGTNGSIPPLTASPAGDPLRYLDSVRAQITGLVALGPATIDPVTGGDLQNSIADIENSVISAQRNGGPAHLQEIRAKISELDGRLDGLVAAGRISAAAANELKAELGRLANTVTD
jgi:serine/threonine-protein kinase